MKSFCIVGLSQFGISLARTLAAEGAQVMVVDRDSEEVSELADLVTDAAIGDPTSPQFLQAAGVTDYDCSVVCLSGGIDESLLATLALAPRSTGAYWRRSGPTASSSPSATPRQSRASPWRGRT